MIIAGKGTPAAARQDSPGVHGRFTQGQRHRNVPRGLVAGRSPGCQIPYTLPGARGRRCWQTAGRSPRRPGSGINRSKIGKTQPRRWYADDLTGFMLHRHPIFSMRQAAL